MSSKNFNKKALKKAKQSAPKVNIKGEDFIHQVPDDVGIELIIHWKGKGFEPEVISPVHAFAKQNGKLKIINRNLLDTAYTFDLKEVLKVYIMPTKI